MIIDMLFYLLVKKCGRFHFFLNLDTLYSGGWGKSPLPLDIFTSNIPYIQNIYIVLMSYAIAYMLCINLKGNMLNRKQWLNVRRVFLSIYLSLI